MAAPWDPDRYLAQMRADVPGYERLQEEVVRASAGLPATTILELGTGTAETARRLLAAHPAARLTGVDSSDAMLGRARELLPAQRAELLAGRLEDRLPPGPFDQVVSALAVHHLRGPAKADLFARVHASLRRGGRFVLGDCIVPERPEDAVAPIEQGFDFPSSVDDQLRWLRDAGFAAAVHWLDRDLAVLVGDRQG